MLYMRVVPCQRCSRAHPHTHTKPIFTRECITNPIHRSLLLLPLSLSLSLSLSLNGKNSDFFLHTTITQKIVRRLDPKLTTTEMILFWVVKQTNAEHETSKEEEPSLSSERRDRNRDSIQKISSLESSTKTRSETRRQREKRSREDSMLSSYLRSERKNGSRFTKEQILHP